MKASQLLKLMLIAALPMRAVEDETAGAEPSSTEAGTTESGERSASASSETSSAAAAIPATQTEMISEQSSGQTGDSPNVATLAASASASGTSSSVPSALPVDGTAAAASSDQLAGEQGNVRAASVDLTSTSAGGGSEAQAGDVGNSAAPAPVVDGTGALANSTTQSSSADAQAASDGSIDTGIQSATSEPAATTESESGNVLAGGAQLVDTTSDSIDEPTDDHPAKPHLAALRRKIESGEAIIMSDLLRLIHAIEETL